MKRLLTASILAASLASGAAFAQSPGVGPYVGGSIGRSNYERASGCVGECDKTDIGFKVFGGYMFTPYIGAEIGYGAFGKAKVGVSRRDSVNAELKSSGFSAFLTAQYPVENWAFFGKIGFGWLDNESHRYGARPRVRQRLRLSTEFAWGLGADVHVQQEPRHARRVRELQVRLSRRVGQRSPCGRLASSTSSDRTRSNDKRPFGAVCLLRLRRASIGERRGRRHHRRQFAHERRLAVRHVRPDLGHHVVRDHAAARRDVAGRRRGAALFAGRCADLPVVHRAGPSAPAAARHACLAGPDGPAQLLRQLPVRLLRRTAHRLGARGGRLLRHALAEHGAVAAVLRHADVRPGRPRRTARRQRHRADLLAGVRPLRGRRAAAGGRRLHRARGADQRPGEHGRHAQPVGRHRRLDGHSPTRWRTGRSAPGRTSS